MLSVEMGLGMSSLRSVGAGFGVCGLTRGMEKALLLFGEGGPERANVGAFVGALPDRWAGSRPR